jgi:hypothetical protein
VLFSGKMTIEGVLFLGKMIMWLFYLRRVCFLLQKKYPRRVSLDRMLLSHVTAI